MLRAEKTPSQKISLERLADFDCDLLLYVTKFADYAQQPLFRQLKVVQARQVLSFSEILSGAHYPNYIAIAKEISSQLRRLRDLRTDII